MSRTQARHTCAKLWVIFDLWIDNVYYKIILRVNEKLKIMKQSLFYYNHFKITLLRDVERCFLITKLEIYEKISKTYYIYLSKNLRVLNWCLYNQRWFEVYNEI